MIHWIDPEKAPKDDQTPILAVFKNHSFAVSAIWNKHNATWAVAKPVISVIGDEHDSYFETDYLKHTEMQAWAEVTLDS